MKPVERSLEQQLLLKKSDKMRLVFWNQDPELRNLLPVVVSVDFVVDQDCFWERERTDDGNNVELKGGTKGVTARKGKKGDLPTSIKDWQQLHKARFVIWTVRNRRSWSLLLQKSISAYNMPIHAIFLIKRKRNLTVDYSCILHELEKQRGTVNLNGNVSGSGSGSGS